MWRRVGPIGPSASRSAAVAPFKQTNNHGLLPLLAPNKRPSPSDHQCKTVEALQRAIDNCPLPFVRCDRRKTALQRPSTKDHFAFQHSRQVLIPFALLSSDHIFMAHQFDNDDLVYVACSYRCPTMEERPADAQQGEIWHMEYPTNLNVFTIWITKIMNERPSTRSHSLMLDS